VKIANKPREANFGDDSSSASVSLTSFDEEDTEEAIIKIGTQDLEDPVDEILSEDRFSKEVFTQN